MRKNMRTVKCRKDVCRSSFRRRTVDKSWRASWHSRPQGWRILSLWYLKMGGFTSSKPNSSGISNGSWIIIIFPNEIHGSWPFVALISIFSQCPFLDWWIQRCIVSYQGVLGSTPWRTWLTVHECGGFVDTYWTFTYIDHERDENDGMNIHSSS